MSDRIPETDGLTPEEEDRARAGEYVLGLLEGEERRGFEARLGAEPALRAMVARWSEDLADLLGDVAPVAPPAGAEAALMRRLFPEPERPGLLARLVPWLMGALAAAAVAFAVLLVPSILGRGAGPELQARIAAEDGSLVVLARFDADTRRLSLDREAGEIPEGRDLELWLVRMEDGAPASTASLGVIPAEPEGVIEVSADLAAEFPANALALSVEPEGGSPTGQATGPVVALGMLSEP